MESLISVPGLPAVLLLNLFILKTIRRNLTASILKQCYMKKLWISLFLICAVSFFLPLPAEANNTGPAARRQYFELRVYHTANAQQLAAVDNYLQQALVPALHKANIRNIGVFKLAGNDTAVDKRMYVLIPYKSLEQFDELPRKLQKNKAYEEAGRDYLTAAHNKAPYTRYETVLLYAFEDMPQVRVPALTGKRGDRVYELRSYESATERLYRNKVEMFNKGGEIALFDRLGFNAVFYGEVLSGNRMPNLMYMTSFENRASRDEHWKAFGADPAWKVLSAKPEYQNNVSKIDIFFLTPTDYSDL